jgi:hypothetical protein
MSVCLSVADRLFTKKWTAVSEPIYRLKLATFYYVEMVPVSDAQFPFKNRL